MTEFDNVGSEEHDKEPSDITPADELEFEGFQEIAKLTGKPVIQDILGAGTLIYYPGGGVRYTDR